jgi:hypothetical protein
MHDPERRLFQLPPDAKKGIPHWEVQWLLSLIFWRILSLSTSTLVNFAQKWASLLTITIRGFGDVPDETALRRQGSKRIVNNTAERWFTWILTNAFYIATSPWSKNMADSRLFPAIFGRGIVL